MKKATFLFLGLIILIGTPSLVLAHEITLPSAGLTPDSPFYFLDRIGEALREFFTFNPNAKAKLQLEFVGERLAEIKVILENKDIEARGLTVASIRLRAHLAKAATIVEKERQKGKDVSQLAQTINDDLDSRQEALRDIFEDQKEALKTQIEELKAKIREARLAGDTAQAEELMKQLAELRAQKELLEQEEDEQEEALEAEEEKLERQLEDKKEAEEAIAEAEEEKQELLEEASEELIQVPADAFTKFDNLLSQAKELFNRGNYQGAEQLAEQAEKSLEKVEEALEDLDEAKEDKEELELEDEKKVREELRGAEEEIRRAERELREAGEED